jgi:thiol:disulfide interchange protein DsbD
VPSLSLGRALLLGLLGGLILNIMPCVLPVIALKILGFVRQSGSRPAEIRRLGLIYGLGVWFSFLVLAGVVIGVKRAVGIASWGMQFGNPVFLVAMTSLVLLVALSLFGVYEINVGGKALDAAGDLASKEGPAGAFFNGMLAVALATPCTAPFLAPALGYAFAASPTTIVLVFSAIAFGLASPYVILSFQPAWLKFLPKPGAWMERFKIAMGFPMLATALWLYTLAAHRLGIQGPLWLGLFLVGLALAAWVWGEFVQRARRNQTAGMIAAVLIGSSFYAFALEKELDWRHPAPPAPAGSQGSPSLPGGIAWQPWSAEAVAAARTTGKPVFVDFTADWCLTCKLNERSSIEIPEVREKLRSTGTIALKGDHTTVPQAISEELQRFGRAGVPLVLVYPRDASRPPLVLPEVLTPSMVLDALRQAAE